MMAATAPTARANRTATYDVEQERELWSSLLLNIAALAFFVLVWFLCSVLRGSLTFSADTSLLGRCSACLEAHRQKLYWLSDQSSTTPMIPKNGSARDQTYANNYLMYLITMMWTLVILTVVNFCFIYFLASEGFTFYDAVGLFFRGHPFGLYKHYFCLLDVQLIVATSGIIVIVFSLLLEIFGQQPPHKRSADEELMSRTVWLHGMPTQENVFRPCPKYFHLDEFEWKRMSASLRSSLEQYFRKREVLLIRVIEARNLADTVKREEREHERDVSDPFVRLSMGGQSQDTHVVMNNLNPKWASRLFEFPVGCAEKNKLMLKLQVINANLSESIFGRRNRATSEYVGDGLDSLGTTSLHLQEIRKSKQWVRFEHKLRDVPDPSKDDASLVFEVCLARRFGSNEDTDLVDKAPLDSLDTELVPPDSNDQSIDDSNCSVKEVCVTPVVSELFAAKDTCLFVEELCEAWRCAEEDARSSLALCRGWRDLIRAWRWRCAVRRAARKRAKLRTKFAVCLKELNEVLHRKFRLSGSAFVTFSRPEYATELLREGVANCLDTSIFYRSHSFWSFGQAPFFAVTLKVNRAPHPTDIMWDNLHVSPASHFVRFWSLTFCLVVGMLLLVSSSLVASFGDRIMELTKLQQQMESSTETLFQACDISRVNDIGMVLKFVDECGLFWLGELLSMIPRKTLSYLADELPTLWLLTINGLLLPCLIEQIALKERGWRKATMEQRQMFLNYAFLCLNSIVLPFFGVNYLNQMLDKLFTSVSSADANANIILSINGVFTLRFLMNATFISAGFQLAQLPQYTFRILAGWLAFTDRQRKEAAEAWPFAWGYWYAWTMSNFALCISMSPVVPAVLPLSAFLFYLRHKVDRFNLNSNVFRIGDVHDKTILIRITFYMRTFVCCWWFIAGVYFAHIAGVGAGGFGFARSRWRFLSEKWVAYFQIAIAVLVFLFAALERLLALSAWERKTLRAFSKALKMVNSVIEYVGFRSQAHAASRHDISGHSLENFEVPACSWSVLDSDSYRFIKEDRSRSKPARPLMRRLVSAIV